MKVVRYAVFYLLFFLVFPFHFPLVFLLKPVAFKSSYEITIIKVRYYDQRILTVRNAVNMNGRQHAEMKWQQTQVFKYTSVSENVCLTSKEHALTEVTAHVVHADSLDSEQI